MPRKRRQNTFTTKHFISINRSKRIKAQNNQASTNVGSLMPTLAEMLKMTKPSNNGNTIIATPATNTITTLAGAALTATTAATPTAMIATQSAQGKISLVPTNFLLQPKSTQVKSSPTQQQMQLLPNIMTTQAQMQQRILLSQGTTGAGGQKHNPTGIVTTGPGGMKVLLVNAEQPGNHQALTANSLQQQFTAANCMAKTLGTVVTNQLQQQQTHQHQFQQMLQKQQQTPTASTKTSTLTSPKMEEAVSRKEAAGMRQLMRQLLEAQTQNNDIQRERLQLERERLEFEKSAVNRFMEILPSVFSAQQQQQQQQTQTQSDISSAPTTMLFNPPKLVFTSAGAATFATGVPTVNGGTAVFAPSNNCAGTTTSLASAVQPQQIEISTQINDFQLLTPKLEKEE